MPYKRYKSKDNTSYTIGVYPTIELLKTRPEIVERVLISTKGESNKGLEVINEICDRKHIETVLADAQIRKLANEKTYSVGIFRKYESELSDTNNHIVLVHPKHQGNLGTIIRTMVGFGFHDLSIIGEAADIYNPETIRSSMGSLFKINFSRYHSVQEYTTEFPNHNLYLFMTQGSDSLGEMAFKEPYSLIFGNEGEGLPAEYSKLGTPIRIEQNDDIDSLNLAVSAGIAMYTAKYPTSSHS